MNDDSESDASALIGQVLAQRYRIEALLGEGGMGAVYRAEHVHMRKPVALKVLHREMMAVDEVVQRFEREAIAAGRIEHPNVVVATDFGKLESGAFYLVLEYVPGVDLTKELRKGPFTPERAVFIGRQIASALAAAHEAGIVHRDLKPDNILLIERGGTRDFVKVLDFGIAKLTTDAGANAPQLTRLGSVFGTPQYMAPEQAAGHPVDHRADIYALGLVLYEMLAGKPAFASDEIIALLTMQMTRMPAPLPSSVPADLSALVMTMLAKDPGARIQSAADVVVRLDALPIAVAPPVVSVGPPLSPASMGVPASTASPPPPLAAAAPVGVARTIIQGAEGALGRSLPSQGPARLLAVAQRPVRVAGRQVPLWLLLAVAVGAALAVWKFAGGPSGAARSVDAADQAPEASTTGADSERLELIDLAKVGQSAALAKLEATDEKDRSVAEWMAIAKGRLKHNDVGRALTAYERALEADSSMAQDRTMVGVVRGAGESDDHHDQALRIAAKHLGETGADILFAVWSSTSDKTSATVQAGELLESSDVKAHASPALRVALALRDARKCSDYKRVLEDAAEHADERSSRPLQRLTATRGCGLLDMEDCYGCLRGDSNLSRAVQRAQREHAPRF